VSILGSKSPHGHSVAEIQGYHTIGNLGLLTAVKTCVQSFESLRITRSRLELPKMPKLRKWPHSFGMEKHLVVYPCSRASNLKSAFDIHHGHL
jgi:hypothetical protein